MKLYFAPRTRSVRPRWLLEELEVPYELVRLDLSKQEGRTAAHLALHPFGEVPVLVDGDVTLFEPTAMCLYLADRFPEKRLAPPLSSPDRGPYLQWLLFAGTTLDPLVVERSFDAQRPAGAKADRPGQEARLEEVLTVLDAHLEGREVVAGSAFSAADVVTASILHLAHQLELLAAYPGLVEYVRRHAQRPATRRAVSG